MVSTDPISDMLTRIRNAGLVNQPDVIMPYSKIKDDIAHILKDCGYIKSVKITETGGRKQLALVVSDIDQAQVITSIKRLSRPGRRAYVSAGDIPLVKRGRGIVIVSTSRGLMTGDKAKAQNLGGELICEVY